MRPTQTSRMLDKEQQEDTELKDRFKEQWKREPSGKLTETLRKDVSGCLCDAVAEMVRVLGCGVRWPSSRVYWIMLLEQTP